MKLQRFIDVCVIVLLFFLFSCQQKQGNSTQKSLTVSIKPLRFFASRIAGKHFIVNVLLPPGANHETWEPTPLTMTTLSKPDMLITVGPFDFEHTLVSKLKDLNPGMKVVNTSQSIQLISESDKIKEPQSTPVHFDPHTWLSPESAKSISKSILEGIIQSDPKNASEYEHNYAGLLKTIDSVDSCVKQILLAVEPRSFLIYHPALTYFSKEYDLQQLSIEKEGKEPSPAQIEQLIKEAREQHIKVIFVSKEFDTRNAKMIAKETNARLTTFDPMSEDWPKEIISVSEAISGIKN